MAVNIKGQKFGHLKAIEYDKEKKKWKCLCDCGNITYVALRNLRTGNTKSCGCQKNAKGTKKPRNLKDMFYKKIIGQLQVTKIDEKHNIATCHCLQCENNVDIPIEKLREMNRIKRKSYTCGVNGCSYIKKSKSSKTSDSIQNGDRFGNLTVIQRTKNKISKTKKSFSSVPMFLCKCDCGREVEVQGRYLLNGNTKSCGCQKGKNFVTKNLYKDITSTEDGKVLYDIYKKWKKKFKQPTQLFKHRVIDGGIKFFPDIENKERPFEYFYNWAIINGFSTKNRYLERRNYLKDFSSENCYWTNKKTKGY